MELGPIALAGPDDDWTPTFAADRRSVFKRLGMATAVLHAQPHGSQSAQRSDKRRSPAAGRRRSDAARPAECRAQDVAQHVADNMSSTSTAPEANAVSAGAGAGSPLSSRPAKVRQKPGAGDSVQSRPFAAATLGGRRDSSRRRAGASMGGHSATFVLASIPHASYLLADAQAPALTSLLVLSDTVCSHPCQPRLISLLTLAIKKMCASVRRELIAVLLLQVRHVFAGTAARTMAQALIHPLDTVKTRLQVPNFRLLFRRAGRSPAAARPSQRSTVSDADLASTMQCRTLRAICLAKVRTPEGLLKTWRKATRQYPFDFHVGPHRIVHARNVLISGTYHACRRAD